MRDYVTKVENGGTTSAGQLSAEEFNELAQELENVVTRSGQTLNQAVLTQVAQSAFLNAVKAQAFQAGGTVDALELTPISGATGVVLPADYTALGGAEISFLSIGTNTGAVTVNIGQTGGGLLGSKSLVDVAGAALTAGAVPTSGIVRILFDATNDRWVLLNPATSGGQEFENIVDWTTFSVAVSEIDINWGSSVYERVEIDVENFLPVDGSDGGLALRFSNDNGSTYESDQLFNLHITGGGSGSSGSAGHNVASLNRGVIQLATLVENQTGDPDAIGISVSVLIPRPNVNQPQEYRVLQGGYLGTTAAWFGISGGGGWYRDTNIVTNGVRLFMGNNVGSNVVTVVNMKEGRYRARGFF